MQASQAHTEGLRGPGCDHAIGNMRQPDTIGLDHAPAGARQSGIETGNADDHSSATRNSNRRAVSAIRRPVPTEESDQSQGYRVHQRVTKVGIAESVEFL